MALQKINPTAARVRWDRRMNRPARIQLADRDLTITNLAARRDEMAAFPAERGPRVTYLVETADGGRASLVFDGRRRRWFVEALEAAA
jgi:hypothetical protein